TIAEEKSETVLEEAEVDNIPAQQQANEQSKDEQDSEEPLQIGVKAQNNAPVQTASFSEFQPVDLSTKNQRNLDMLLDVPLQVTVELGRTRQNVSEILELASGSIIELDKLAGEPVDVL